MEDDVVAMATTESSCQSSAAGDEPSHVANGDEQNGVRTFSLVESSAIRTIDTPASSSARQVRVDKVVSLVQENTDVEVAELEPLSETESDDTDGFRSCTLQNDLHEATPETTAKSLTGHERELNQRLDPNKLEVQPEDEDASIAAVDGSQLRQRRSSPRKSDQARTKQTSPASRQPLLPQSITSALSRLSDLVFVLVVLGLLFGFCVAICYCAFHPIHYPLPNVDALFEPFDVSNVSVRFRSPAKDLVHTNAVLIEWEIANFPAEALRKHGPEPFEYRVFLDSEQILFDVGVWAIESEDDAVINTTLHRRLRPRDIARHRQHTLALEVTFAIPGSDDELVTLSDTTTFISAALDLSAPRLDITYPLDGAIVRSRSFVLEYRAQTVHRLDVVVDGTSRLRKRHISDGNLLLRDLSDGFHSILLEAFDDADRVVAMREIHIEIAAPSC